eukprot:3171282-Alexandrium_andersonii.AAC.1
MDLRGPEGQAHEGHRQGLPAVTRRPPERHRVEVQGVLRTALESPVRALQGVWLAQACQPHSG